MSESVREAAEKAASLLRTFEKEGFSIEALRQIPEILPELEAAIADKQEPRKLTDDEIRDTYHEWVGKHGYTGFMGLARAIEAKLREG